MQARLDNMTGEELLLVSIFGGRCTRAGVDRELDRRALMGPPARRTPRRSRRNRSATASLSFRQVA